MKCCSLCLLIEYATVKGEWGDFHVWWQTGAEDQAANRDARMTPPGTVSGKLIASFTPRSSVIAREDLC